MGDSVFKSGLLNRPAILLRVGWQHAYNLGSRNLEETLVE